MNINIIISDNLYSDLLKLSQMTKTDINTMIENQMRCYIGNYVSSNGMLNTRPAYIIEHGEKIPCEILDRIDIYGKPYYKIYKSNTILNVPIQNIELVERRKNRE